MGSDDAAVVETGRGAAGSPHTGQSPVRRRVAVGALWALVFVVWTATRQVPYLSGLLFVLLGASALLLTTVAAAGWRATVFRTTVFWEAAARGAWTSGALGTIVFFESVMLGPSEGLAAGATRLAQSFVPFVCGCVLAMGLLARMMRAAPGGSVSPLRERLAGSAWDLWFGRTLFAVLVVWPLLQARWSGVGSRLADSVRVMDWPALLVLFGAVAAIRLIGGQAVRERAASASLTGAGTFTALAGLVQALLGIAGADIATVAAGMSFLLTACFTTLLGLALVTFPQDDRRGMRDATSGTALATRVSWVLFPLLTAGLLAITFLMILTPMTRRP
jgi:hypothetical protein